MKRLAALLAATAVTLSAGSVSASGIDGAGGELQGAGRLHNQKPVQPAEPAEPPTPPAPQAPVLTAELQAVFDLTNVERTSRGLAPLTLDPLLTDAALAHSTDQAARGVLTHYGSDGSGPGDRISDTGYVFRTWAENAAAGYRTGSAVMNGWMNSPGHRQNILNPNVTEVGLAIAYTATGYSYWTQVFAAPR